MVLHVPAQGKIFKGLKNIFVVRTWLCAGAVLGLADAELGRQLGPQQQRLGRVQRLQGRKIFNIYHKNICCSLSVPVSWSAAGAGCGGS